MIENHKSNEGFVCDAVLKQLEELFDGSYYNLTYPERDSKIPRNKRVELTCYIGNQKIALEHTKIEAYENQIYDGVRFQAVFDPIREELSGKLPTPGLYELIIDNDALIGIKNKNVDKIQEALCKWIKNKAKELYFEEPERKDRSYCPYGTNQVIRETPEKVPFEVTFVRKLHWAMSKKFDGKLIFSRYSPEDIKALREKRIEVALNKKLVKLAPWKLEGYTTVLALESNDAALSYEIDFADAVCEKLKNRDDVPDIIYLVGTEIENSWSIFKIKNSNVLWSDEEGCSGNECNEIDPSCLSDITEATSNS